MKKAIAGGLTLCLLSAALSGCQFRFSFPKVPDQNRDSVTESASGEKTPPVQTAPIPMTSEEIPSQEPSTPGEEPGSDNSALEFHKFDLPNNDFDTGVMYAHDDDKDQVVLYIETWNEYVTIENITDHDYTAFLIDQDTGVFITQVLSAKNNRTFRVDRFQKGSSEIVSSTFEASLAGSYYDMYYYPVNDQTGYLAICGVMLDDLPNGTVVFFKTTDCGLTWQEVSEHGSFRFSCHAHMPHPVFFCMFTEDIGIYTMPLDGDLAPVYITFDGWKSYEDITEIVRSLTSIGGEVIDCVYKDEKYWMTIKGFRGSDFASNYDIIHCVSDDLIHWEVLPKPDGK